jgi:hypothetical protein
MVQFIGGTSFAIWYYDNTTWLHDCQERSINIYKSYTNGTETKNPLYGGIKLLYNVGYKENGRV